MDVMLSGAVGEYRITVGSYEKSRRRAASMELRNGNFVDIIELLPNSGVSQERTS